MILKRATYKAIKYACLTFHYATSVPVNVFGYSVFNEQKEWCGVILFGTGANHNMGNPYKLKQGQIVELVLMALNGKQKSTSKALSIALKLIKKDLPLCQLIVSYADVNQGHEGIIYQATNWYYVGTSLKDKKDGSFIVNGKRVHGKTLFDTLKKYGLKRNLENIQKHLDKNATEYVTKGKIKYLYPLTKDMRLMCESIKMNYKDIEI